MPITAEFGHSASPLPPPAARRPAPFSLRLSEDERSRLITDAGPEALGTYIKSKLFDGRPIIRRRGPSIADRESFAKALALLGQSHLASNLNQLAKAVNIGALPLTPETESELQDAIRDVRAIRSLLMRALGMRSEDAP